MEKLQQIQKFRNNRGSDQKICQKLKNNKTTTRSDNIKAEIRKESKDISARLLHTLFNKVWEEEKVSEQ